MRVLGFVYEEYISFISLKLKHFGYEDNHYQHRFTKCRGSLFSVMVFSIPTENKAH